MSTQVRRTEAAPLPEREVAPRERLRDELARARARTDEILSLLTADGLYERPVAERHRLIFYLGHLEAFDWNLMCRDVLGRPSLAPVYEKLFAFGIDPLDGQLPNDGPSDWPAPELIRSWGHVLRGQVDEAVETAPFTGGLEDGWALRMAIEHRWMHAETLLYLLHRLDGSFKRAGPRPEPARVAPTRGSVRVPAGTTWLGLSRAEEPFLGWDNEYERHQVEVPEFEVERAPVSNAQWLEFVDAGGYRTRSLWTAEAWAWLEREKILHPAFWRWSSGQWWWRAMFGDVPLPMDWPVYVSHAEATAYTRWRGGRLPTEAEWHRAVGAESGGWEQLPRAHFDFVSHDPVPTGSYGAQGPWGLVDLVGNGWEWTSTVFAPFEGFQAPRYYPGYSANFFDSRHFVLKGASAATARLLTRPSFRNWFQPHYQYVFAKFRRVLP